MFGIIRKREVLKLIGERTHKGKGTSFRKVEDELLISSEAACSHLKRLWRERLIKSTEFPSTYQEAARWGQSIRELHFRISRRGIARLDRWTELEKQERAERWWG